MVPPINGVMYVFVFFVGIRGKFWEWNRKGKKNLPGKIGEWPTFG
jgi:hypothetical protein